MPPKRALEPARPRERKRQRTRRGGAQSQPEGAALLSATLDFNGVWKELVAAGWTPKPPRGLDNRYRYVLPGGSANGEEGIDFLLGEEAVLRHYVEHVVPVPLDCALKAASAVPDGGIESRAGHVSDDGGHARGRGHELEQGLGGDQAHATQDGRALAAGTVTRAAGGGSDHSKWGSAWWSDAGARVDVGVDSLMGTAPSDGAGDVELSNDTTDEALGILPVLSTPDRRQRASQGGDGDTEEPAATDVTPRQTPQPPLLQDVFLKKMVAFAPSKEPWMRHKVYRCVGTAFIVGRVCRHVKKPRNVTFFQVMWLDSQFQISVETVSIAVIQRGIQNYQNLMRLPDQPAWRDLAENVVDGELSLDLPLDELEMMPGEASDREVYDPEQFLPASLAEVEVVKSMRFVPNAEFEAPTDLFQHEDGSTATQLLPQYHHVFAHSASSSFFAYIPVYFWKQVVLETNQYAAAKNIRITSSFSIDELMTFLGIMFYMTLTDKGEYANYWGPQTEDAIFGGSSTSLDSVMSLNRFKLIRRCLSFRADPGDAVQRDAAARIRPLLNLLKCTGGRYIKPGRDLALDEASIACRSRHGRHLIVFNPQKPGGKYHFKMYVVCCATTWVALNYRLHCTNSDIADRLVHVVNGDEIQDLREELDTVQQIRKHVLEVVRPYFDSRRIVNMDNYYTSVQLLLDLRLKGLYARGTVRGGSKHFPKHTVLQKDESTRGDHQQAVSTDHQMLAASWCDGNIVTMVTNADASSTTVVTRRVGNEEREFPAPSCILQYNRHMQGVDRLDQFRARFSLADGHSYKRWHKKLALALVDIARCNAYLTRRMAIDTSRDRDPHRSFLTELVSELITGKWREAPSDDSMRFGSSAVNGTPQRQTSTPTTDPVVAMASQPSPQKLCESMASKQTFAGGGRKRRQCIVCRYEDRYPTEVTDYCVTHCVCLCRVVQSHMNTVWTCPQKTWTCWEKYHRYYQPQGLFSANGNIRRSSSLAKLKKQHQPSRPSTSTTSVETDRSAHGSNPVVRRILL